MYCYLYIAPRKIFDNSSWIFKFWSVNDNTRKVVSKATKDRSNASCEVIRHYSWHGLILHKIIWILNGIRQLYQMSFWPIGLLWMIEMGIFVLRQPLNFRVPQDFDYAQVHVFSIRRRRWTQRRKNKMLHHD